MSTGTTTIIINEPSSTVVEIDFSYPQGPVGPIGPTGINTWGSITGTLSAQTDLWSALSVVNNLSAVYLSLSGGTITGNIAVTGTASFANGALTVDNSGNIAANSATINSSGSLNVANKTLLFGDGSATFANGKTSISNTGVVTAPGGNSNQWNTAYTTVTANSATWTPTLNLPSNFDSFTFTRNVSGSITNVTYTKNSNTIGTASLTYTTTNVLTGINDGTKTLKFTYDANGRINGGSFI